MTQFVTDAEYAERMLRAALGGEPQISDDQIADLMVLATTVEVMDAVIVSKFTEHNLSRAASLGWQWKSGITANQYDLGGGPGKTLDRSQWFDHCMRMAAGFADGTFSVLGSGGNVAGSGKSGIGVITVGSSLSQDWGE